MTTPWNGSSGTPIQLRTHAPRQMEEQRNRQPTRKHHIVEDDNYDAYAIEKPRTSAIRYDRPQHRRTSMLPEYQKTTRMRRGIDRWTLIIIVTLFLIVMLGGWWLFSRVTNWWTNAQNDWKYGSIRTYHPDHFIVVNTHGQVIVIQLNPQDPNLDHIYGITTTSDPKTPVSLNFRPTGTTWAMYVIVGDTNPYSVELVSDGKQFVSPH